MNNWIPKSKIVKLAIATVSFSVILYFVGLLIILNEMNKIENFYGDTNSELFKEDKFWAIKSIAEKNKEPIQTLRDFFIQKGDEVKFIEEIEGLAKTLSIKFEIISIDVKANQLNSFKEDVSVEMKIEGSWKDVISFVDKLKKMPFGVSIEKVDLDSNTPGDWSGSVSLVVFREK
jgi:Tfp pilus assembly protein PilO